MAFEVPEKLYDYLLLPSAAWCGVVSTGWIVAGEKMATNIALKSVGPWSDEKVFYTSAIGALGWWVTLSQIIIDPKASQRNRCLIGTGFLLFSANLARSWKSMKVLPRVALFVHGAIGLFFCMTKPKGAAKKA